MSFSYDSFIPFGCLIAKYFKVPEITHFPKLPAFTLTNQDGHSLSLPLASSFQPSTELNNCIEAMYRVTYPFLTLNRSCIINDDIIIL